MRENALGAGGIGSLINIGIPSKVGKVVSENAAVSENVSLRKTKYSSMLSTLSEDNYVPFLKA